MIVEGPFQLNCSVLLVFVFYLQTQTIKKCQSCGESWIYQGSAAALSSSWQCLASSSGTLCPNLLPAQEDLLAVSHSRLLWSGDGSGGVSLRAHPAQSCQQWQPPLPAWGKTFIQRLGKASLTHEGSFILGA